VNTNRISIINQDQSESLPVSRTSTYGFTVIKAEKGAAKAVFIPAGDSTAIYENFGYTSADYPHLQEVLDFNASHGLYISAPYDVDADNKVPVAYVTPAGIFARAAPVSITGSRIEDIEHEEATINSINSFSTAQEVLIPLGREPSYFDISGTDVAAPITYTSGDVKVLSFNLGFNISPTGSGELASPEDSKLHFLNPTAFSSSEPERILRNASSAAAVISIDIPGASSLIDLYLVVSGSNLLIQDDAGHDIGSLTGNTITSINIDSVFTRGTLSGLYAAYFSANAIATTWASESFRNSVKVYWKASLNYNAIYATIYQKYLSQRETVLTFSRQTLGNVISFTVKEKITPTSYGSRTITGSLLAEDTDGFGAPIGFKEKLANQSFINIAVLKPFDANTVFTKTKLTTGPTMTLSPVYLNRGKRVATEECLEDGWVEAENPEYDSVEVFFTPTLLSTNETKFTKLANTHKLSRFVASKQVTLEQVTTDLPQLAYGANYFIITNLAVRRSGFTREDFISPLVGAYAGMIAKCIDARYGGVAPMFLNQGGVGGQLEGISVKKMLYKYSKDQLDILDAANYNPIMRDSAHGIMVYSQKTAKAGPLSDWSFIGHASAFLLFQRQVRDQIMIPQIGKPNNPYYRDLRAQQALSLLRPRIEGLNRIWAYGTVDTASVNTPDIMAQRKFVISIVVKVDIFSEGVELRFTNLGQDVTIG